MELSLNQIVNHCYYSQVFVCTCFSLCLSFLVTVCESLSKVFNLLHSIPYPKSFAMHIPFLSVALLLTDEPKG